MSTARGERLLERLLGGIDGDITTSQRGRGSVGESSGRGDSGVSEGIRECKRRGNAVANRRYVLIPGFPTICEVSHAPGR